MRCPTNLLLKSKVFQTAFFCLFVLSVFVGTNLSQTAEKPPEDAIRLEIGKVFEREFTAGADKHVYQIDLTAGQYFAAALVQNGVDVTAELLAPDGKRIAHFDGDPRPKGNERIEFAASLDASYQIVVAPRYKNLPAGKYSVKLEILRAAEEKDRAAQDYRAAIAESFRLQQARKYDEAFAAVENVRLVLEKTSAPDDFFYGIVLRRAGVVLFEKGDYARAEDYFLRAVTALEKALGGEDPRVSETRGNLAVLYNTISDYEKSAAIFREILDRQEKIFGENHPFVAAVLNNYGNLSRRIGDYARAETLHLRSLAVREKLFGAEQPEILTALAGLSTVYYEKKDFQKVKTIDERALLIAEKNIAPEDPRFSLYLSNAALANTEVGNYERAEQLFLRALAIREKAFGADSVNLNSELYNLGLLYAARGDYAKSDSFYRRSLKNSEAALPAEHPMIAKAYGSLAANHLYRGEAGAARPLFEKQLAMREKSLGRNHPETAETLNQLARACDAAGDAKCAVEYQTRANDLIEEHLHLKLYSGSETQQLAFFEYLSGQTDQIISMQNRFSDNKSMRELGATTVLQRKGRVQDLLTDSLSALRLRSTAADQKLLKDLSDINARLAKLVTAGAKEENEKNPSVTEREAQIAELTARRETLENEISRLSAGFIEKGTPLKLDALRAEIPENAVLLEFAVYRPYKAQAAKPSEQYGNPRYAVYLLRRAGSGEVEFRDLGEAAPIETAIRAFRETLRDPKSKNVVQSAQSVYEKIIAPVKKSLGAAEKLLISPDGELNLIPFEALADENGRYLIENYSVTYLTSGRDLLRMKKTRASRSGFLVVANPDFGSSSSAASAGLNASETNFAPLGGTAREASAIRTLFPAAALLTAEQATETALKRVASPRLLHIATHGFFLADVKKTPGSLTPARPNANAVFAVDENPLLRSGLALAGANRLRRADENSLRSTDDGILTALEAANLNLWGTKLVVLSACDTGLGQIRTGEGVYGLRRAFTLAGAETLVMSLWSVSDAVTRELMTDYYKNLKAGRGRGAALREVRLALLKRGNLAHPFYWAGFIQTGEWADLDGRR